MHGHRNCAQIFGAFKCASSRFWEIDSAWFRSLVVHLRRKMQSDTSVLLFEWHFFGNICIVLGAGVFQQQTISACELSDASVDRYIADMLSNSV